MQKLSVTFMSDHGPSCLWSVILYLLLIYRPLCPNKSFSYLLFHLNFLYLCVFVVAFVTFYFCCTMFVSALICYNRKKFSKEHKKNYNFGRIFCRIMCLDTPLGISKNPSQLSSDDQYVLFQLRCL